MTILEQILIRLICLEPMALACYQCSVEETTLDEEEAVMGNPMEQMGLGAMVEKGGLS